MSAPVTVYTSRFCLYCSRAKRLLQHKQIDYQEIDVTFDFARRREMVERARGRTSVPQIWIGEHHAGGCEELYQLEAEGRLDALVQR